MWRQMRSPSLSRRIVVSVAVGLGLIQLFFGVVALWSIQESSEAAYRERVMLAQVLAEHVDEALRYAMATLQHEATEITLEAGHPLTESQRSEAAEARRRIGGFVIVSIIAAGGTTLWTDPEVGGALIGTPLEHPSAQLALRRGTAQMSEFRSATDSEAAFLCMAVPLRDRAGQVTGVLMAELDPDHPTLNLLFPSAASEGVHVQLVSGTGQSIAGTRELDPSMVAEHQTLMGEFIATRTAGYRIHAPSSEGWFPSHLVAYAPVPSLPSWGVVVEQPQDLVLAVPHQLQQRLVLFGLLALLLAAAVAWVDVRRVVRPLKHLTATAERFAAGQLDEPVHLQRADELGILARAFETMRQRLRASLEEVAAWNRELERRVAARTAELEARNHELALLYQSLQARERERAELLQQCITAQEEERRRVAQELHDETSQALVSLQRGLERLAAGVEQPEEARRLAGQLRGVAAETRAAVHGLAIELRPNILDDVGMVAAIQQYLQGNARRGKLEVDFAAVGIDHLRLIPAAETAIYRIVQAALTNSVQHAQAEHVSVMFQRRDAKLVVVVEDDGQGFDLAAVHAAPLEKRLGLAGMGERAALIGGALTVETSPGAGTTVFLEVPLGLNARREDANGEAAAHTR
ncbi:MAG: HAMP domain-containing protein [Chloroflexi bacterium]|nr:HAMP domain-containing protein [Chloroflexota bacterium]